MDGNGTAVSNTWGIVLAGGSGRRLAPLTTRLYGEAIPKQFAVLWSALVATADHSSNELTDSAIANVVVVLATMTSWRAARKLPTPM